MIRIPHFWCESQLSNKISLFIWIRSILWLLRILGFANRMPIHVFIRNSQQNHRFIRIPSLFMLMQASVPLANSNLNYLAQWIKKLLRMRSIEFIDLLLFETYETKTTLDSYFTPTPMGVTNRKIHNRSFTSMVNLAPSWYFAIKVSFSQAHEF